MLKNLAYISAIVLALYFVGGAAIEGTMDFARERRAEQAERVERCKHLTDAFLAYRGLPNGAKGVIPPEFQDEAEFKAAAMPCMKAELQRIRNGD